MGTPQLTDPQLLWEKYMGKASQGGVPRLASHGEACQRVRCAVKPASTTSYLLHGSEEIIFCKTWRADVLNDNFG